MRFVLTRYSRQPWDLCSHDGALASTVRTPASIATLSHCGIGRIAHAIGWRSDTVHFFPAGTEKDTRVTLVVPHVPGGPPQLSLRVALLALILLARPHGHRRPWQELEVRGELVGALRVGDARLDRVAAEDAGLVTRVLDGEAVVLKVHLGEVGHGPRFGHTSALGGTHGLRCVAKALLLLLEEEAVRLELLVEGDLHVHEIVELALLLLARRASLVQQRVELRHRRLVLPRTLGEVLLRGRRALLRRVRA
mmetsp:Transcript_774/g.2091  ORF Transcript_774/g.2091 Transcript_774/m.2091 type:complete len:251 (-) Transcript_774:919-1671(-)